MNQRTEASPATEPAKRSFAISDGLIRWLIVTTCATLFLVNENYFTPSLLRHVTIPQREITHPSAVAYGVTTRLAVGEYYDQTAERALSDDYLLALAIYLIFFIAGPTFLFFAWRSYGTAVREGPPGNAAGRPKVFLPFLVGGILTLAVALPAIPKAVIPDSFFDNLQKMKVMEEHRDAITRDLLELVYDAYQYSVLPRALGGGENSFEGYTIASGSPWGTGNRNAQFALQALTRTTAAFRAQSKVYPSLALILLTDSSGRVRLPLNEGKERDHER